MKASWQIRSATWSGQPAEVSVKSGTMTEAALVELATSLLMEARNLTRMREDRARLSKQATREAYEEAKKG